MERDLGSAPHLSRRQELFVSAAAWHRVRPGETMSAIAKRYGVTVQSLVAVNNLADPDRIASGKGSLSRPWAAAPSRRWPGPRRRVCRRRSDAGRSRGPSHPALACATDDSTRDRHPGAPWYRGAGGCARACDLCRLGGTYGLLVNIDHGNGIETRYAHASRVRSERRPAGERGRRHRPGGLHRPVDGSASPL